jgi:hypothetical protein
MQFNHLSEALLGCCWCRFITVFRVIYIIFDSTHSLDVSLSSKLYDLCSRNFVQAFGTLVIPNLSFLSLWFYSPLELGRFFSFLILYTVGKTPWTSDQPAARPLPTHRATQTQNKRTQTSMPRVGFELTIPAFERAKTVRALRCPYTYESGSARVPMSQTRLCVGRHEPGSPGSSVGLGSLLARTCEGGPEPVSRIHTANLRSSHDRPVARERRVTAIRASGVIAFRIAVSCFAISGFTFASTSHILK